MFPVKLQAMYNIFRPTSRVIIKVFYFNFTHYQLIHRG